MINDIGNYSLYLCIINSLILIYFLNRSLKSKTSIISSTILSILSLQLFFVFLSFFSLVYLFVTSDFSNLTVFNNSHVDKPLFYKISGTWGNHEGSLVLWLLVLTVFIFLFSIYSKEMTVRCRLFTIIFQEIIIFGFLLFVIITSNPFETIFPVPKEGLGLNPILQDPALAVHPPILYLGYVGTSIIFSSVLSAMVTNNLNNYWATHIKKWIFVSWIFLTLGILLGSIWAYYELGWGGFWFWDPVENVSLMPWLCLTALFHSILVLEKRNLLKSWVIILALATFILSISGTFLVRSGILNSVHTFASDPARGSFILIFLFFLTIMSIVLFFKHSENYKNDNKNIFLFSKETFIIINNWFLMYFLIVVLIGTTYPIFLEVISNEKISVGPPFYNKLIIPFVIPFLILMSFASKIKWIKHNFEKIKIFDIIFFILSIYISVKVINISKVEYLFSSILFASSFFLFFFTLKDLFDKKVKLSQKISHTGFSILILSILINGAFSKEITKNMKIGDQVEFLDKTIIFDSISVEDIQNYKALRGNFIIKFNDKEEVFKPEVRVYKNPEIFTSEADIKTNFFEDNFLVFNIVDEKYFNVRYQYKPFMLLIWISVILISLGGVITIKEKNGKKN